MLTVCVLKLVMLRPEERLIFQIFYQACPDFADRPVNWTDGADPPDVLCTDVTGRRIGVELGEWLNEAQIRANKRMERWQDSYLKGVRSQDEPPPKNFGIVWLGPKSGVDLSASDSAEFRAELLSLLHRVDNEWPNCCEWQSPQGAFIRDLAGYPCLARYLTHLQIHPKWGSGIPTHYRWVCFPARGGAYSPRDAVDALLDLLRDKAAKYSGLHAKEGLTELYLIAYYNKALFYNSPYLAPGFGLPEVATIAGAEIAKTPGAFQKIFLFNATEPGLEVFQLWPGKDHAH
jgi:hypothetical protein